RRRHTRCLSDWSSDVCSSDLMRVVIADGKILLDEVETYFAVRKVSIGSDGKFQRILLNDKPLFQIGLLDQGFWPDGIYSAPTDRSEERRVGKEGRSGVAPSDE